MQSKQQKAEYDKRRRLQHLDETRRKAKEYYERNRLTRIEKSRAYHETNRERDRLNKLKRKYGITKAQFEQLLKDCGNKCPVCKRAFTQQLKMTVDHCHNSSVIRGLICNDCNMAEGFLRSPENARRLYEYMLKNEVFYKDTSN